MKRIAFIIFLLFGLFANIQCHEEGSEDATAGLLGLDPPRISSISPRVGTPTQTGGDRPYSATNVTISGFNFGLTDTKIYFNGVEAPVFYNIGTEIATSVPDGATTGSLSIVRPGGQCIPFSNTGFNCASEDFFVDCYSPYANEFGTELQVDQTESLDIEFDGNQTKAIRIEVPTGQANVTINCESIVSVKYFSPSCAVSELLLVTNPTIPITNARIMQMQLTASSATCSVSAF
ncbi:LIC10067 family putative lipoprotein [Leptospira sp. GIMC2001]|uniref:LIC10067 family putative lipoprotein n=1 Tax=Leptospira sp. GIMC2001 TaxID=1513297 RepID=UPI00234B12AC|nr:hypothetical protein [Leptospira sp. GIMC2001]WCL50114.1 hypothetical protein O4O04_04660 [Leptospira sp. GIMC2001]